MQLQIFRWFLYFLKRYFPFSLYELIRFWFFSKDALKLAGKPYVANVIDRYVIFIHIPKAAGTSIKQSLRSLDSFLEWGHQSYFAFNYLLGSQIYQQSFSFAFVRNPWDRLVSEYFYIKNGSNSKHKEFFHHHLSRFDSFSDFVIQWLSLKHIYLYSNFLPQYRFITNSVGNIMVSHVARFEQIDTEIDYISSHINYKFNCPVFNASAHDHYRSYYTDKAKEVVREIYRKDIELFGYQF